MRGTFVLTQIILTLVLGAVNFSVFAWWMVWLAVTSLTSSGYLLLVIGSVGFIFVLPIFLSISASTNAPHKVIIAPLDINIATFGIAVLSLLGFAPNVIVYTVNSGVLLAFLAISTPFQNGLAASAMGLEGSEDILRKKVYSTEWGFDEVVGLISRSDMRESLEVIDKKELEDGSRLYFIGLESFRIRLGVSKQTQGNGCLVSVIGFVRETLGLREVSQRRFDGKCADILTQLPELKLREEDPILLPQNFVGYVMSPTKGVASSLKDAGSESIQTILLIVAVLTLIGFMLYFHAINEENALGLVIFLILTQIGNLVVRSRGRKSGD